MSFPDDTTKKRPKPVRVPAERAAGLDAEITAQPRPLSAEIGADDGAEAGLSLDPEGLGARYLSEAIQQGEAPLRSVLEVELSLASGPASDDALTPPNFEYENTLWEQTVDLTLQARGEAAELRAPPAIEDDEEEASTSSESSIRELSLFDRADDQSIDVPDPSEGTRERAAAPKAQVERSVWLPAALRDGLRRVLLRIAAALRRVAER